MSEIFVRLEVGWLDSPKLIRAGIVGRGIHAVAMCLAKRGDDDGWFDRLLMVREGVTEEQIETAIGHDLLEVEGDMLRPWDWLDRNPSQAAIDASRSARKRGGAIGNHRRWKHPGPFGECPICHPALEDSQVVARSDRLPIASDRLPSPEKERETETETETEPPPDSQDYSQPEPIESQRPGGEVDQPTQRRAIRLVAERQAAHGLNPTALAATIRQRLDDRADPDRQRIDDMLASGQTPEQIAEQWSPDPPAGRPTGTTDEITQAEIRARASERHAAAKARQEEITQAEPARPEAVREILATTRRHRTGATT